MVVAYDLNLPDVVDRLARLGNRARVIIDNSDEHHGEGAAEDKAEMALVAAGVQVKRQKKGKLQHNKIAYVDGAAMKAAIGGSTNMSWRGLFVQSNNLL
ncbi:phospholipase D-like domain-containing protein [Rhizobium leguminosarum]|uniref:phospholipase D-like domain-containing protein n=1 Tax=Rhizobium leguminosarum TaxID=384 RepID=UPI0028A74C0E|nr:phospholipase D-like domain-containing protein [Rhizobium leguminosarum]